MKTKPSKIAMKAYGELINFFAHDSHVYNAYWKTEPSEKFRPDKYIKAIQTLAQAAGIKIDGGKE